jgi:hypothetical protein
MKLYDIRVRIRIANKVIIQKNVPDMTFLKKIVLLIEVNYKQMILIN